MADSIRLRITAPDGSKKTLELTGNSFILGRGEEANVRLTDPKVSELHVRLKVKDGQLTATDLGSDAGTTLDGETLGKETPFGPGQELRLGDTVVGLAEEKGKFEKGGKGKKGGKSGKGGGQQKAPTGQVHRVEAAPIAASASASASTDGNAARVIEAQAAPEPEEEPTKLEAAPEPAHDEPKHTPAHPEHHDRERHQVSAKGLSDYATRFLSEQLPEALRPTKENRRLQVALVWGKDQFLDVRDVARGQALTVGSGNQATFRLFHDVAKTSLALVQPQADGEFRMLLPAGTNARVSTNGETVSAEKLVSSGRAQALDVPVKGASLTVGLDDRVNLEFGNLQVIARYTRPQPQKSRPVGERIDVNFLTTVIILILAAIAFERMIAITDFSHNPLSDDLFKNKDRFAKYIARQEQKEKPKFQQLSGVKEGAKAKDDEGKFGKKEEKQKDAQSSKKGAPVVDVNKREEDRKKVMNSGLIALLGQSDGAVSNVLGPGGVGTGLNNMMGGRGGTAMGDAQGVGGLGSRGGGSGGGGNALGIGGLGGHGGGRGRGGSGEFDLGGKGKGTTQFVPGKTTVLGGLTADEVGRIIRRHWNEIKYCYEKELNKDPNLYGKVAVYFVIGPVGDVTEASVRETTMNAPPVEECMLSQVRRWKFPSPRGGGVVQVNYPFIFKPQE